MLPLPPHVRVLLSLLCLASFGPIALAQSGDVAEGHWQGAIDVGMPLEVDVRLVAGDDDWSGTIDIPAQGASGLPLAGVAVDGDAVRFAITDTPGEPTFDGVLAGDTLEDTFTQSGQSFPFTLTRVDADAPMGVAAAPAAPAAPGPGPVAPTPDAASGETLEDPEGRFTAPVPIGWTATVHDGYVTVTDPDEGIRLHLLAVDGEDLEAAVAQGWARVEPDFAAEVDEVLEPPSDPGVERTILVQYEDADDDVIRQAVAQLHEGVAYLMLIDAELATAQRRGAQLNVVITGFEIAALEAIDLTGVEPLPFEDVAEAFGASVREALTRFGIPGAAVAIVQGDEVVYAEGFGVRVAGGDAVVTSDTHMMIGSTGKTMTTLLMAALVDADTFDWDTPVLDVLPEFAVADDELTQTMTLRNLVCACSGVPRRDLELFFHADELSAEDIVASLRTFEFFTDFGEAFQYSNQLVGTAGYATAAATGAEYGDLYAGYVAALQEYVLGPIGLEHTTLSFDDVVDRDRHGTPHRLDLETGAYVPLPLEVEALLGPIAPAGAHWSTADDMARYLITQLNVGVAPDGTRVVSEENLRTTWEPQVPISATESYGLGWMVGDHDGLEVLHHGGNTLGFTSDFAFLPDADFGVVVLANAQGANAFTGFVRQRLFELVFEQPARAQESVDFALAQLETALADLREHMGAAVDADAVAPYVGTFANEALGEITLGFDGDRFVMDAGEFRTELRPMTDDDGELDGYLMLEGPIAGSPVELAEEDGEPVVELGAGAVAYTFGRVD